MNIKKDPVKKTDKLALNLKPTLLRTEIPSNHYN